LNKIELLKGDYEVDITLKPEKFNMYFEYDSDKLRGLDYKSLVVFRRFSVVRKAACWNLVLCGTSFG
jgi:hypothetical protein